MSNRVHTRLPPLQDPFSPLVLMVMLSLFGFLGPILFVSFSPVGANVLVILEVTGSDAALSFGFFLVYFIFWILGYFMSRKVATESRFHFEPLGVKVSAAIRGIVLILFVLFLWLSYKYHPAADDAFRASLTSGVYGRVFFFIMTFALVFFGITSVNLASDFARNRYRSGSLCIHILLWSIGFILLVLVLFSLGGRGRVMSLAIVLGAAWHYYVHPIGLFKAVFLALSVLAAAIILPVIANPSYVIDSSVGLRLWGVESGRTFDGLYNLTRIVNWWQENGTWGYPGELWVGDILGDLGANNLINTRDAVMMGVYGRSEYFAGFPATKPGELLLNFGLFGIPVGGWVLGYLSGRLYFICVVRKIFGYASIPIYIMILFRTGLASPLGYFAQNVVLSVVMFLVALFLWAVFFGGYRVRYVREFVRV